MNPFVTAFLLSSLAGFGTFLGGCLVVFFLSSASRNDKIIGRIQGISAGVMLFISFFDIIPESLHSVSAVTVALFFFMGIGIMALIDHYFPDELINRWLVSGRHNSTLPVSISTSSLSDALDTPVVSSSALLKSGYITFIGMALHNMPEGFAVLLSTLRNPSFGVSLAFAIFCHNIPEGMSVAIPLFYATRDKMRTLQLTFINGLFEPVSVFLLSLLMNLAQGNAESTEDDTSSTQSSATVISDETNAKLLGMVAGVMTFVSLHELYPSSIQFCSTSGSASNGRQLAMMMLTIGMLLGYMVLLIPV
jgi:ZIP family zinc transporter